MNKVRRGRLVEATDLIEQAKTIIEECKDEEQEYHDNMPESFQQGDKGSTAESNISELENAEYALEGAIDDLGGIIEKLDEATSSAENGQE